MSGISVASSSSRQDWHPADHGSFAANHPETQPGQQIVLGGLPQILWPVHCVEGTSGADFPTSLDRSQWKRVFQKGRNPVVDSYSGFFDNARKGDTGLRSYLLLQGVRRVCIVGLALDYDNEPKLTDELLKYWVDKLKLEFV